MYTFLINPVSHSGKGIQYWNILEKFLKENGVEYEAHFSRHEGDMMELSARLTKDLTDEIHLVILGGDGTVNESLQGIQDFEHTKFSYIPTGSSNDLTRDMKISKDPLEAMRSIMGDSWEVPMDVGVARYLVGSEEKVRRFCVSCGIGFDAAVCRGVSMSKMKGILNKIGLGKLVYLGIALTQIIAAKMAGAKIIIDNEKEIDLSRFLFITTQCHGYEGGGFWFCPEADYQDGKLDVCIAGDIAKWKVPAIIPAAFLGKHFRFKNVYSARGESVQIQAAQPLCLHTDGEVLGDVESVTLTCLHQVLRFVY